MNIRAVSAPPEHNTPRRMNVIAKTILEQIGGRRFAAMTGSKDFTDMGQILSIPFIVVGLYFVFRKNHSAHV